MGVVSALARLGICALPLLLAACAKYPSIAMRPAAEVAATPPAAPAAAPAPAAIPDAPPSPAPSLPPPVAQNRSFVTVHGIPLYRIGPGDVLEVIVTRGLTQDKQTVTVRSDGGVAVGLATAKVDGATVEEAADRLRDGLALYFRDPRVEVAVKEYQSKRVMVLGAVGGGARGGAGVYPLTGRTTLSEILARAGGATLNADLQQVQLTRADGTRYTINLFRLIVEGELRQDVVLDAGDTIFVPFLSAAGALAAPGAVPVAAVPGADVPRVFIFGEVRSPGAYTFSPNMRVAQALAQAGGLTDTGLPVSVRVIRGGLDKPEIIEANFERLLLEGDRRQDLALLPNDIVVVPRTGIANWNAFLAKLRPTLEFLTLGTASVAASQGILIQQRILDRGPTFR